MTRAVGALAVFALLGGIAGTARGQADVVLPPGFRIETFASGLGSARFMALSPRGDLLVAITRQGTVLALPDRDGNGRADRVAPVAEGLDLPHGLAVHQGFLYVAETGRVIRYRYDSDQMRTDGPAQVIVPAIPKGRGHFTRTIAFGPDGRLYLSVGSSCNVCVEQDPRRAAIVRYQPDGSGEELFATGLRNAVGILWHPGTRQLWATNNGRDWLGDDLPPEYVTVVKEGAFYGWPHCYARQGKVVLDPEFGRADRCRQMTLPTVEIQAHSAPLGLALYTGRQFPEQYRGNLFVAFHGSWNRSVPTGYKVIRIKLGGERVLGFEDFATGWLQGTQAWGRPVDLLTAPDGSLFLSDDRQGLIYRIRYAP
jgi:glucose/arabinose dehydrogenase